VILTGNSFSYQFPQEEIDSLLITNSRETVYQYLSHGYRVYYLPAMAEGVSDANLFVLGIPRGKPEERPIPKQSLTIHEAEELLESLEKSIREHSENGLSPAFSPN